MNEKSARYQHHAMIIITIAFLIAMVCGYLVPKKLTREAENMTKRIREIIECPLHRIKNQSLATKH